MYREQLEAYFKSRNINYTISGKELKTKCLNPEHADSNPSFSINYATGLAYCFSCQFKTHADRILGVKQDEDQERLSKYLQLNRLWEASEDIEEPVDIILPPIGFRVSESIRGIPGEVLEELGVYYCTYGRYKGRLVFPIRDVYGNLLGFDARIYYIEDSKYNVEANLQDAKYLRPTAMKTKDVLYPLDYLVNHPELGLTSISLTEGIFDALSYIALGKAAVCNFGLGAPSQNKVGHLLSLGAMEIINSLDTDSPSIKAWQGDELTGKVGLKDIWRDYINIGKPDEVTKAIRKSGHKDANDYLQSLGTH